MFLCTDSANEHQFQLVYIFDHLHPPDLKVSQADVRRIASQFLLYHLPRGNKTEKEVIRLPCVKGETPSNQTDGHHFSLSNHPWGHLTPHFAGTCFFFFFFHPPS